MHKKIAVKSHQTKRVGHMCKKIAEISRQKKKEGHRSKEKLYMSQQYRWSGHKDKEKQYMSQQQNKRTIGSRKSCVDLIFHPPPKKTQKRMRSRKENIRKNKS